MNQYRNLQEVLIIGASGRVGKTLVEQVLEFDEGKRKITGVVNQKGYLYDPSGLGNHLVSEFSERRINGEGYKDLSELLERVRAIQENKTIFVDSTNAENITPIHLKIMRDHFFGGMVTANKFPLVGSIEDYKELTQGSRYDYLCSVMAGASLIEEVRRSSELKDVIMSMEGCLSGTNAKIIYEMKRDVKFSASLRDSHKKGHTESDPREDMGGRDVSRKLLILARCAGFNGGLRDIELEPFLPEDAFVKEESVEEFLDRVGEYDEGFAQRINKTEGKTLQYIAEFNFPDINEFIRNMGENRTGAFNLNTGPILKVGLKSIPKGHRLARLEGTENGALIRTKLYDEDPIFISAPGAGLDITARNIRAGLNRLEKHHGGF